MKNKVISIIGGGIFGVTTYLLLRKAGFNCQLFEQKKDFLKGASSNNLNRIHFGFHYPRDSQTARQSYTGYRSFKKFYDKSIIKNFKNYYVIANRSKVNFNRYIKFCDKHKLKYKIINRNNFFKNRNIEGIIKTNEPIYDWNILLEILKKKIGSIKNNEIYFNTKIDKIKEKNNSYILETKNKKFYSDYIIDSSYHSSNTISKSLKKNKKYIFQLVIIAEVLIKSFYNSTGLAVMDGPFFSILPLGKSNKYLLYDVKHSVIRSKISKEFNYNWLKVKKEIIIKSFNAKVLKNVKKFFPDLAIKFTSKYHISPRIIMPYVKKTDKRISKIEMVKKNYLKIISAKVDHSVDLANNILKIVKKDFAR